VGGSGGRSRSVAARIVAKQEFAGYWEYVLDRRSSDAGASQLGWHRLIGSAGELLGIARCRCSRRPSAQAGGDLNISCRSTSWKPILDDMLKAGPRQPAATALARLYATEIEDKIVVVASQGGPAQKAASTPGDVVLSWAAGR